MHLTLSQMDNAELAVIIPARVSRKKQGAELFKRLLLGWSEILFSMGYESGFDKLLINGPKIPLFAADL